MHKDAKYFENHLHSSCWYSLDSSRWVPMCQRFNHFWSFLQYFVFFKLATISVGLMWDYFYAYTCDSIPKRNIICEFFIALYNKKKSWLFGKKYKIKQPPSIMINLIILGFSVYDVGRNEKKFHQTKHVRPVKFWA